MDVSESRRTSHGKSTFSHSSTRFMRCRVYGANECVEEEKDSEGEIGDCGYRQRRVIQQWKHHSRP